MLTEMDQAETGEVVVFESADGSVHVDVVFDGETVWLTQSQMGELFGRERSVIARHIGNVFREGELEREGSVQILHRTSNGGRPATLYNLDVIISVGYRVKSKRGTQFRIWATDILRDYLRRGYALNERRLAALGVEAEQAIELLATTMERQRLTSPEGEALLQVVRRYARTWRFLRAYDEDELPTTPTGAGEPTSTLDITTARAAIRVMRDEMIRRGEEPGLFGQERGDALESILLGVEQSFGGEPVYPTVESRAAHLLYFIVKNHPLTDGNKRTASLLFLEFLRRNGALARADGGSRFSDTALVALTLLVAESKPAHKELVIRLVLNLLVEDRS